MKRIYFIPALVVVSQLAYSQVETAAMASEFKEISKFGSHQSGFEGLQTYSSGIVNGSQFFSPSWSGGSVTTVSNQTFSKGYSFLFDKVRQELFLKWKDSSAVLLADKKQINSFTLNTDKPHYFVAGSNYEPAQKDNFFEALVKNDKGYTLLKLIKTKFVKGDERDIEKQRLGEIYDSFNDEVSYFISFNNSIPQQVALKEKSIKKVLASVKDKVDSYFSQHSGDSKDELFLTGLVQFINN